MSAITTHVLDTALGRPAAGARVSLDRRDEDGRWTSLCEAETDQDGRARHLMPSGAPLMPGVYRLTFDTGRYFGLRSVPTLYPAVVIVFETVADQAHYHVPLLVSPFGYSTYRGS